MRLDYSKTTSESCDAVTRHVLEEEQEEFIARNREKWREIKCDNDITRVPSFPIGKMSQHEEWQEELVQCPYDPVHQIRPAR